ncbi:MAG: hypothetical protein ACREEC_00285, partial [Thermoplasmata archaeon]
ALGYARDPRLASALRLLEGKRNPSGNWNLDAVHPDTPQNIEYHVSPPFYPVALEVPGSPSRWITVRALSVLRQAGRL